MQMAQSYSRGRLEEAAAWEQVSRSADFDQAYPTELPYQAPPMS
ncbi:hypothetical protein ACWGJB_27490 [Streptomyces sp. NPDC054813]